MNANLSSQQAEAARNIRKQINWNAILESPHESTVNDVLSRGLTQDIDDTNLNPQRVEKTSKKQCIQIQESSGHKQNMVMLHTNAWANCQFSPKKRHHDQTWRWTIQVKL